MAVIWQREIDGKRYEVRSAGATRRLYTSGVCHSQYNPDRPVTGGVWDLLLLPAFFYPPGTIRRVLVLGTGGGGVIRQLRDFLGPASIVGVELDAVHLEAARKFFAVDERLAELHRADAEQWLSDYAGPPFDMIVDDLYGEQDGLPVRAVPARARWWATILKHLDSAGLLVANFTSRQELRGSAYFHSRRMARAFPSAFQFTLPGTPYANAVGAFLRRASTPGMLRRNLCATPELDPRRKTTRLRYRVQRITKTLG